MKKTTTTTPFISVVIPLRTISYYLVNEGLPAFAQQTYKMFEVIVLPNHISSQDAKLLKKFRFLKIIETHDITRPAQKRDIGVKHARGSIVAFIDDDAYPHKNWLSNAVAQLDTNISGIYHNKIAAVCGPGIVPRTGAFWEQVFQTILESKLGSGGYTYRFIPEKKRFVDDYPSMNFIILKHVFEKVGGFDSNFWPGEDSKLCEDIVYKLEAKILYDPTVLVYHHRRPVLAHFLKQHGNYGYHRGAFFAHGDRNSRRLNYLVPTFFTIYLSVTIIYTISIILSSRFYDIQLFSMIIFTPALLYFFLLIKQFFSAYRNKHSLKIAIFSSIVLFLMHVYYGVKFVHGFFTGLIKKDKIYD